MLLAAVGPNNPYTSNDACGELRRVLELMRRVIAMPALLEFRCRANFSQFVFALLTGAPHRFGADMAQHSEDFTYRRKFGAIGLRQF
jgi:hypothetical protein